MDPALRPLRARGGGWALAAALLAAPVAAAAEAGGSLVPVGAAAAAPAVAPLRARAGAAAPATAPEPAVLPVRALAAAGSPAAAAPRASTAPATPTPTAAAPRGPAPLPQAPASVPGAPAPLDDAAFAAALRDGDLDRLYALCRQAVAEDRRDRLRQLHARLLVIHPAPQPLGVVLANAETLLGCLAPEAALTVLDRIGPAPGPERIQWLVVQWRAASGALDHRRAALALQRLAQSLGPGRTLESLALPMRRREDGTVPTRPAVDELAEHLAARGLTLEAAQVLLASRLSGPAGADRLRLAAGWGTSLSIAQREALLERALDQAAAAGAWGLVNDLLDDQLALPAARARERRLRLAPRLDDAYGEWLLRQGDPASLARARELEGLLRSPRRPGGHAAALPDPLAAEASGTPEPRAPGTGAPAPAATGPAPASADAPQALPPAVSRPPSASPQPFPAP